MLEVK